MAAHKNQLVVQLADLIMMNGPKYSEHYFNIIYHNEDDTYSHDEWTKYSVFNVSITDFDDRMKGDKLSWHPELEALVVQFMVDHFADSVIICTAESTYISMGIGYLSLEKMAQKDIDSGSAELDYYTLRKDDRYMDHNMNFSVPYIKGSNVFNLTNKQDADALAEQLSAVVVPIAKSL